MGRYPTKHQAHSNLTETEKEGKLKSVFSGIWAIVSAPVVAVVAAVDELKWKREQRKMGQAEQQNTPEKQLEQTIMPSGREQDAQYFANRHDVTESIDETIDRVGLFDTNANPSQKNMSEPSFEEDCL